MRRGTTPTHTFNLPFSTGLIAALRITYVQNGEIVLNKTEKDVEAGESSIAVTLTQEETLQFKENRMVEVQMKVLTTGGDLLATDVYTVHPLCILDEEVLRVDS